MPEKLFFSNNFGGKARLLPCFPQISKPEVSYSSFIELPNEKVTIKIFKEFLNSYVLSSISILRDLTLRGSLFLFILKTTWAERQTQFSSICHAASNIKRQNFTRHKLVSCSSSSLLLSSWKHLNFCS